jgi:hypothetical protein
LCKDYDISGFTLEHAIFRWENKVDFRFLLTDKAGSKKENTFAPDPGQWLESLRAEGTERLFLQHQNNAREDLNHKWAGMVGGGGRWLICAKRGALVDLWTSREQVTRPDDPAHRIWEVNYLLLASDRFAVPNALGMNEAENGLRSALDAICDFAQIHAKGWFESTFEPARQQLDAPVLEFGKSYVGPAIPEKYYSAQCLKLLLSAQKAWAFGGMGSWNDLVWQDKEIERTYDEVSAQLFDRINDAIVTAVNEPWQP